MTRSALFDAATDELHAYLSSRLHTSSRSAMVVRRLLPDSNEITVDLSAHRTAEIDRFVLSCLADAPNTITASAGTLQLIMEDAEGVVVVDESLTAGVGDDSKCGVSDAGEPGEWTVTIVAMEFDGKATVSFNSVD